MNSLVPIVAVLNSLWQAAIVTALVWLALKLARRMNLPMNAATRYVIWWVVLGIVALLPVAPRIKWSRLQPAAPTSAPVVSRPPIRAAPERDSSAIVVLREERSSRWPLWVVAAWAAVFLYRLAEIARSYFYLQGVKRRAAPSSLPLPENKRPASLLRSHEVASPMAVGFLRPAVILPASLESEITEKELRYVLLHEYAHLERRDDWWNLIAHLLGAALALHPAAWWILRQIEREREMACDDWVVARTGAARPYAASLARLSELHWSRRQQLQGEALAAGIFGGGSRTAERIEALLRGTASRGRSRLLSGFLIVLPALAIVASSARRWIVLAQEPAFEVASVKPNDSGRLGFDGFKLSHGSFRAINVSLQMLVETAYRLQNARISGGPNWFASARFDITAKANQGATDSQIWQMVQSLLADRFRLAVHRETRNLPVYELLPAKSGPKLRKARDGMCNSEPPAAGARIDLIESIPCGETASVYGPGGYFLWGKSVSASALADALSDLTDRPVADRTGLSGSFEVTLQWKPDVYNFTPHENERGQTRSPTSEAPNSIFLAVQEQLGLKLEAAKGPVEILVVDHAEKPDAN